MRKHGWQLPYHPLQVVAVAVFLALGFAFYVFFVPFVGRKVYQYIVMGLYTPLITCVFGLYIWCAAADPADPGVFKSKKYVGTAHCGKHSQHKESKLGCGSTSSTHKANTAITGEKHLAESVTGMESIGEDTTIENEKNLSSHEQSCCMVLLGFCTCAFMCNSCNQREKFSEKEMSEEGMFFCSLCEVEVFKYSKHCRVCDKCVDRFDHHCRWLNNCIGQKNYRQFFTLMVSAILLLILQWSIGILVMICCFLEHNRFSVEINTKLGSSFSLVPFVVVVASCTILAMLATLPLAQLFFFHVLLIKKGISTYDYIVALREQDQQGIGGQQSPQMSTVSSLTGLSSASSFNTFHRGAWCTPPRLFLEDQFDVVPADTAMSVSSSGKRMAVADESIRKKNAGVVRLSPWTLARLNPEEVSKVAAQARKKSRILQPVVRRDAPLGLETDRSFGSNSGRMFQRPENRRRTSKRVRLPADLPLEPLSKIAAQGVNSNLIDPMVDASTSLAPLQQEARSAFRTSRAMSALSGVIASSPESSLDSPDVHQFRVSSSGAEEGRGLTANPPTFSSALRGIPLSRSTSDGYEASGGEDSDRVPSRVTQRSTNWSNLFFSSRHDERALKLKESYSSSQANSRNL